MSIELICPSRGRPEAATALAESFAKTGVLITTSLVFAVDEDDPTAKDYPRSYDDHDPSVPRVLVVSGPPTGDPTGPLNSIALASEASIVGFIGDDSRLATKGWDAMVEEALREPGFAWGDDGTGPAAWPSTAFCSTDIVRRIGYFALPTLRRGFFDVQWISVARGAGIERVVAARFPHDNHEHPVAADVIAADEAAFNAWKNTQAAQDIASARLSWQLAHFFPADLINV